MHLESWAYVLDIKARWLFSHSVPEKRIFFICLWSSDEDEFVYWVKNKKITEKLMRHADNISRRPIKKQTADFSDGWLVQLLPEPNLKINIRHLSDTEENWDTIFSFGLFKSLRFTRKRTKGNNSYRVM